MLNTRVTLNVELKINIFMCVSYCVVCASIREDNPRALASGLSYVQTYKP